MAMHSESKSGFKQAQIVRQRRELLVLLFGDQLDLIEDCRADGHNAASVACMGKGVVAEADGSDEALRKLIIASAADSRA